MNRYQELAEKIKLQIRNETWRAGEKIPSIRMASRNYSVGAASVLQAYQLLESQGWLTAKPQSGYFVTSLLERQQQLCNHQDESKPEFDDDLYHYLSDNRSAAIGFGSALPDPDLFPFSVLNRHLASAGRQFTPSDVLQDMPPGNEQLRRMIAQRYLSHGINVSHNDIVITSGAMEALNLSMSVVTKPDDTVILESPTFYGAIQAAQRNRLNALSIDVDPVHGIDLEELEKKIDHSRPKAMWVMPNFHNPTGICLSDETKCELVNLANQYDFYLIEDDVYAELHFDDIKPKPLKFWDSNDRVLLCGSFSKSLCPGFRIGWVVNRALSEQIQKQQLISTLSGSSPIQQGLVHYLKYEGIDNHLRKLRKTLKERQIQYLDFITRCFPSECRVHAPSGGYFVWIELPVQLDAREIYRQLLLQGVSIAYGDLFDGNYGHSNCLRLNVSLDWSADVEAGLTRLSELINANC